MALPNLKDPDLFYAEKLDNGSWFGFFKFDIPDLTGIKEPHLVRVRERVEGDPPSNYWGWRKTQGYSFIQPRFDLFEMCFPYGVEIEEEKCEGKRINLIVSEEPLPSNKTRG